MSKYENLHLISPNLFFLEIEKDMAAIDKRQRILEETIADVRSLADALLEKKVRSMLNPPSHAKKWYYDVRIPNYTLENIYATEEINGTSKRWVGPERLLEFSCLLDRAAQYEIVANLIDFMNDEIRQEFVLKVDDEEIPWLSVEDTPLLSSEQRVYTTIIPQDPRPRAQDRLDSPSALVKLSPRQSGLQVTGGHCGSHYRRSKSRYFEQCDESFRRRLHL